MHMNNPFIRRLTLKLVAVGATRLGYRLVRDTMYSPVPDLPDPDSGEWDRTTAMAGLEIDTPSQTVLFKEKLAPYFKEFFPPGSRNTERWRRYAANGYYCSGDAEVLYGMIRHLKPQRILELGAGFSTMITAMACAENAREGHPARFVSSDPEPRISLDDDLSRMVEHQRLPAQGIAPERFLELQSNDVLFIDSTHTVKRGSDVNHLVLEVLPRLNAGVVVHFHDIFLPWDYPREWFMRGTYLAEQYLLQAYLSGNRGYWILLAMQALARRNPRDLQAMIPDYQPYYHGPSAFWIRRLPE